MNVIAKISCYLERSVVTLKFHKEYLNTVTYNTVNTPVLLWIKYWTVWYIERYSMSRYAGVTNFQKIVRCFDPPLDCRLCTVSQKKNDTDVAHYNFNTHQPILVIFGRDVAERLCYQMLICYLTSHNYVSALVGETWTWTLEIVSF